MTTYTHTAEQHAQLLTIQKQLIDLGDTKTAALLDWAVTAEAPTTIEAPEPEFCYSINEEDFNYLTAEEAIDMLACDFSRDELVGKPYWVGEAFKRPGSYFFNDVAERLLERADSVAYDEAGEHSEGFGEDVADEAVAELEAFVKDWADRSVPVNFWAIRNVRRLEVTAEDVDSMPEPSGE